MGFYRKNNKDGHKIHLKLSLKDPSLWRAVFCEFFGTFILIFFGLASVLPSEVNPDLDNLVAPGLCFAAIIVTLIHVIGPTSGCNINPAVTLALVIIRPGRLHPLKGLLYFIAQILGAVAGSGYLRLVAPSKWVKVSSLGMTKINSEMGVFQGVGVEVVATMLLVLLVLVISDHDPEKDFEGFPSLSGGLAVLGCVYAAAPYTGASLNPARSFGPALVMLDFKDHWVYWVGPLSGSLLAVGIYMAILVQGMHKGKTAEKSLEMKEEEGEKMAKNAGETNLDDISQSSGSGSVESVRRKRPAK